MFRHGLRVSEACGLVLEQVDVESRVLHDARLKGGLSTTHPLRGDEIRAIKAWLVERTRMKAPGRAFFLSEQRKPLHRSPLTSSCANTARRPSYRWPFIPTCCAVPAALPSPTKGQIPASFRTISGTATFSTPSATPPPTRRGSRSYEGSKPLSVNSSLAEPTTNTAAPRKGGGSPENWQRTRDTTDACRE